MGDAVAEKPASGEGAVGLSRDLAKARKSSNLAMEQEAGVVRYAGDKRFVRRGDVWVDEDYRDDMDVIEIEFLSDEYFELLGEHPDIKRILALGKNVTFVFENRAYRITS